MSDRTIDRTDRVSIGLINNFFGKHEMKKIKQNLFKKKVKDKEKISQSVIVLFFIYRFIEKRVVELKRILFDR